MYSVVILTRKRQHNGILRDRLACFPKWRVSASSAMASFFSQLRHHELPGWCWIQPWLTVFVFFNLWFSSSSSSLSFFSFFLFFSPSLIHSPKANLVVCQFSLEPALASERSRQPSRQLLSLVLYFGSWTERFFSLSFYNSI